MLLLPFFSDLMDAAEAFADYGPEFIFAEPVGSCVDLSATILQPLRSLHAGEYAVAPLSVLVDPASLEQRQRGDMDGSVEFLFSNQIAEADLLCVTKQDLYPSLPAVPFPVDFRLSGRTGSGVEGWLQEVLHTSRTVGARILDVDYRRYAEAEAALGWLNLHAGLALEEPLAPSLVVGPLLDRICNELTAAKIEIAHLKIFDRAGSGWVKVAVTTNDGDPQPEGDLLAEPSHTHALAINLRALADPVLLDEVVRRALETLGGGCILGTWELFDRRLRFRSIGLAPEFRNRMEMGSLMSRLTSEMSLRKKPVTVLWNSAAGWSDSAEQARRVETILSQDGASVTIHRFEKGEDITETSRRLIAEGSEVLVAAGGDGTVNAVASAVVNSAATLAVIPAGTLNHFARDLSIPLDLEGAALCASNGQEIETDVGCVNGWIFINNSVLGLYPVYRAAREAYERRGLGQNRFTRFLAVVRALARVLWHVPHLKLRLQLEDGRVIRTETPFVLVANNEHEVENWNIGHREAINQGHLWVYVMRRASRWSVLRFMASFLFKRFSRHQAFDIYRTREVMVDSKRAHLRVGVDGEIVKMETPLVYRSLPRSLRVIAPQNYLPGGACGA